MVHKKAVTFRDIDRLYEKGKITDLEKALLYMAKEKPSMFRKHFGVVQISKGKDNR